LLVKVKEIPSQKYELSDLTKVPLNDLKRRYELGMVFTAMLGCERDPRAHNAAVTLAIQMRNIWNEWHARMAVRELEGKPALEIWQRISKADLIKIANRDPAAIDRNTRKSRPLPSDQVVALNSLDIKTSY
jgi:hypothetical protein